eukprot:TRINITY_DN10590_c0_g1_i4.p1 TRINITY_DN10590_c0_g1~~TRINITY_DN10590_c0_g1_i4.p1  ORF type:complete len:876 (+),score=237.14 TRINITY_DN10590_c0_g1_i4:123-2750(+)
MTSFLDHAVGRTDEYEFESPAYPHRWSVTDLPTYEELRELAREDLADVVGGVSTRLRLRDYAQDLIESVQANLGMASPELFQAHAAAFGGEHTQELQSVLDAFQHQIDDTSMFSPTRDARGWKKFNLYSDKLESTLEDVRRGVDLELLKSRHELNHEAEELVEYQEGIIQLGNLKLSLETVRDHLEEAKKANTMQGELLRSRTFAMGKQLLKTAKNEGDLAKLEEKENGSAPPVEVLNQTKALIKAQHTIDAALVASTHKEWQGLEISQLSLSMIDKRVELLEEKAERLQHPPKNRTLLRMYTNQVREFDQRIGDFGFKCTGLPKASVHCEGEVLSAAVTEDGAKRWLVLRNRTLECYPDSSEGRCLWNVSLRPEEAAVRSVELVDGTAVRLVLTAPKRVGFDQAALRNLKISAPPPDDGCCGCFGRRSRSPPPKAPSPPRLPKRGDFAERLFFCGHDAVHWHAVLSLVGLDAMRAAESKAKEKAVQADAQKQHHEAELSKQQEALIAEKRARDDASRLRQQREQDQCLSEMEQKQLDIDRNPELFFEACKRGDLSAVRRKMAGHPHLVDSRDPSGCNCTGLMYAAGNGYADVCEVLLAYRAEVDAVDNLKFTPLHLAAYHNHPETLTVLLAEGADTHSVELHGRTALDFAEGYHCKEALKVLRAPVKQRSLNPMKQRLMQLRPHSRTESTEHTESTENSDAPMLKRSHNSDTQLSDETHHTEAEPYLDVDLVTRTWKEVCPIPDDKVLDAIGNLVFVRLFEVHPEMEDVFAYDADHPEDCLLYQTHVRGLIKVVDDVVARLTDVATVDALRELGRKHKDYEVESSQYDLVGEAFLWGLEHALELRGLWSPPIKDAWALVWGVIVSSIKQGQGIR